MRYNQNNSSFRIQLSIEAMDLDNLLNPIQQTQLAQELAKVLARNFGHLEIRIEKCAVRWLRPGRAIYNPLARSKAEPIDGSLADILGYWAEPLASELAAVMGDGFGSVLIGVEHGRIRSILASIDVRARTGKTGDIHSTTALHP